MISDRQFFTSSILLIDFTVSLTLIQPLYVHTCVECLCLNKSLTVEKSLALAVVRSSLIYTLMSLVSLDGLSFFLFEITRYRSAFDRNLPIIGLGSVGLAFLGFLSLWLTSMSLGWRGGSSCRTVLAMSNTAAVVSSFSLSSRADSGMPLIRSYCGGHISPGHRWLSATLSLQPEGPRWWCHVPKLLPQRPHFGAKGIDPMQHVLVRGSDDLGQFTGDLRISKGLFKSQLKEGIRILSSPSIGQLPAVLSTSASCDLLIFHCWLEWGH